MNFEVDWRHGAGHMWAKHRVTIQQANEALVDDGLVIADPDPKSTSGVSARVLGYSPAAGAVLVVILVHRTDRPGAWWGANGWRANATDTRTYAEHQDEGTNND